MAEWLKAHAWKACIPQGIQGSNPCLSAIPFQLGRKLAKTTEISTETMVDGRRHGKVCHVRHACYTPVEQGAVRARQSCIVQKVLRAISVRTCLKMPLSVDQSNEK